MSLTGLPGGVRIKFGRRTTNVLWADLKASSPDDRTAEAAAKEAAEVAVSREAAVAFHVDDRSGERVATWLGPPGMTPPANWWVKRPEPPIVVKVS